MPRPVVVRRSVIREIISTVVVPSEIALQTLLRDRGFTITQATISCDLAAIGAAHARTRAGWRYTLPRHDAFGMTRNIARLEIDSIAANESLIVIKTRVGHAAGVAVYLDSLGLSDVLSNLAGDDAVLVIPRSHKSVRRLLPELHLRSHCCGQDRHQAQPNAK